MKDNKRLTIRNDDGTWGVNYLELANEVAKWQEQHATQYLSTDLTNILGEKLANIEDKIENGILIELPYKLGTELHFIVLNMHSVEYEIFTTEFWAYVSQYKDEFGGVEFAIEINDVDFDNDTLIEVCNFLTKAEAEAKLRELKGERE